MYSEVNLYSSQKGEISKFLKTFYEKNDLIILNEFKWEQKSANPVELADIIGTFIDNNEKYKINMWVSFDKDIFINVTESNVNGIIKYLYERFPY